MSSAIPQTRVNGEDGLEHHRSSGEWRWSGSIVFPFAVLQVESMTATVFSVIYLGGGP